MINDLLICSIKRLPEGFALSLTIAFGEYHYDFADILPSFCAAMTAAFTFWCDKTHDAYAKKFGKVW